MRAITVRQPWAEAIATGHKTVENRSPGFLHNYRGPIAIHAAQAWSERGQRDPRIRQIIDRPGMANLPRGALVALAEIVDIHPDANCCHPWGEQHYTDSGGNVVHGPSHILLENVNRIPEPVLAIGHLGLWTIPAPVEASIREQLWL